MTQTVLVTGATGFIGRQLCQHLKQSGHVVVASGRTAQDGPWDSFKPGDLAGILPGDLCDGIDVVYHLAGVAHAMQMARSQQDIYQRVNVDGTRHLLELVRESEVKSLVYFSSIKAMADPGNDCVDETFTEAPTDLYGLSKLHAEQNVLDLGRQSGFHVCCLRPTLVYGPNPKGNIMRMLSAIRRGRFPVFPEFNNRRSMVSVDDLVEAAALVANDPAANGQTYIVSDGQDYSTRRIYELMSTALKRPVPRYNWPVWPFHILAKLGDLAGKMAGRPFGFNSEAWHRLRGSACYQSDKLRHELGWRPQDTLETVLPAMVRSISQ